MPGLNRRLRKKDGHQKRVDFSVGFSRIDLL